MISVKWSQYLPRRFGVVAKNVGDLVLLAFHKPSLGSYL